MTRFCMFQLCCDAEDVYIFRTRSLEEAIKEDANDVETSGVGLEIPGTWWFGTQMSQIPIDWLMKKEGFEEPPLRTGK